MLSDIILECVQSALFIGFFSFIVIFSVAAAVKFYFICHFSRFVVINTAIALSLLSVLIAINYSISYDRRATVMLSVLAYPTLLVLLTSMLIWRASYWELSRGNAVRLTASMLLVLTLIIAIMIISSAMVGAVLLAVWALLMISVMSSLVWRYVLASRRLSIALGSSCLTCVGLP